jgi:ABC-type transporter Mla maintaining outer membrane lipid asymmetry permease subunit MlaE
MPALIGFLAALEASRELAMLLMTLMVMGSSLC